MKCTLLRNLLTAVVCLFTGLTAQAQFTGTVNQVPRSDWAPVPATFNAAEVATALGTDAATLLAALDSWIAEGSTDANMFFYAPPSAPDTWSDGYTTGGEKGFWLNEDAEITAYGNNSAFYCNPVWDNEASTFSINIGMMPDMLKYGIYNKELKFSLQYNGNIATFTIDFTVTGIEKVELPEIPSLKETDLTIVGEKSITVEQYPRTSYDADNVYLKLEDVVEKLGITDANILTDYLAELLYTTQFDTETVGKLDTLTNNSTAGAPGWWYTDIRVNGQATGECSAATYSQGDYFFAEGFAYNAESDTLSCRVGQYPGKCEGGEQLFANLYIIWGEKAYRIRINFNVLVKEQGNGLDDYTKVGETIVKVEMEPMADYTSKVVKPDLDAIAAALGCEVSEIRMKALDSTNSFAGPTANNGGFWFDHEGFVCSWGSSAAMYVEPVNAPDSQTNLPDLTSFSVGQYPNALAVDDERDAFLYFFNGPEGDKYYTFDVHLTVVKPKEVNDEFTNVRTFSFGVQAIPSSSSYSMDETWTIDLAVLENILGTSDVKLYGLATDANAETTGSIYSDKYSCTPYPGFWLDADGRVSVWQSSSPVGICYASDGTFTFFQYPGTNNVGDVFKTQLFLVNVESGDMITFNINVSFVSEIINAEVVGEEDIMLPVSTDDIVIPIDLTKAAEALGVTVDDLVNDDNNYLCGLLDSGLYSEGQPCYNGLGFGMDGYYSLEGNTFFTIEATEDGCELLVYSNEAVADNYVATGKFCFQIDNKRYIFNMRLVSPAIYSGIENVSTQGKNAGKVFDLSGRQVLQPARGLYIQNGKKVVVK